MTIALGRIERFEISFTIPALFIAILPSSVRIVHSMSNLIRACLIGAGGMARHHIRTMLNAQYATQIVVICEPSAANYAASADIFTEMGLPVPPNEPDLKTLLHNYADKLDAAFIITPHALHHDQTKLCLEAGLDVLLEKPMVMNALEAQSLIEVRDRTQKLLVVAFQGGLSPQIRFISQLLQSGELGELLNISGEVWQDWSTAQVGTWRQMPEMSGGGFMFDTGAHMLNTVCDLAGQDFLEVAAWLDNRERPVDILGAVMGRLQNGALVTLNACGNAIPSCASDIKVFTTKAIIHTGQWGERLSIQKAGAKTARKVTLPPMRGAWEQFLAVRAGEIHNPCPPEVGLRMARLWDAIRESSSQGGIPVRTTPYAVPKVS